MLKYFLDRNGQSTKRIAGLPGGGHIEAAMSTLALDPKSDVYQQMFALGYVRVTELEPGESSWVASGIMVDAPRGLTKAQRHYIEDRMYETGKTVSINSREHLESRATAEEAAAIVANLL